MKGNFKLSKEIILFLIIFCASISIFAVVHPIFPQWEQRIGFASSAFLAFNGIWTYWSLFTEKKIKAIKEIEENFNKTIKDSKDEFNKRLEDFLQSVKQLEKEINEELKEIENKLTKEIDTISQEGQAIYKEQDNKFTKLNELLLKLENQSKSLEDSHKIFEKTNTLTKEKFLEHWSRMDLLDLKLSHINKEYNTRQKIISIGQEQKLSKMELKQITDFLAKMGFKKREELDINETDYKE